MNIGIDARLYHESGVGRYIRNLIAELMLIDTRNTYTLFVRPHTTLPTIPLHWNVVEVDIGWHSLAEQVVMPWIIRREQIDLMHFPYFNVPVWCPCPFVVTIHDLIINHFPTGRASTHIFPFYWFKRAAYQLVMYQAVKRAAAIIVPSKATEKELRSHYSVSGSRVQMIHEGVLSSSVQEKKPSVVSKDERFFLYVGNAYPHKNLERLIDAFVSFRKTDAVLAKEIKLVLVGKRDFFHERLKNRASTVSCGPALVFAHDISDDELIWLYRHTLALVFPSLMEGFGLPAVEAMKEGAVVAVSNIDAFKEVCDDAALYFDPHDTDSIAHAMKTIASPAFGQTRTALIKKGHKRASVFNWYSMAQETLKTYERCVGL